MFRRVQTLPLTKTSSITWGNRRTCTRYFRPVTPASSGIATVLDRVEGAVPKVTYRVQGDHIRFSGDAIKLRMGGYWWMAANRTATRGQFEKLVAENPAVEFVEDEGADPVEPSSESRHHTTDIR